MTVQAISEAERPRIYQAVIRPNSKRAQTEIRCGSARSGCPQLGAWRPQLGCELYPRLVRRPVHEWLDGRPLYALRSRWQRELDHGGDPMHRASDLRTEPGPSRVRFFDDEEDISDRAMEEASGLVLRHREDRMRLYLRLRPGFGLVILRCPRCRGLSLLDEDALRRKRAV